MTPTTKDRLRIESVMKPFPHSIGVEQSLKTAKTMLEEHNIRHLPVQQGGKLVGILSDRDIHHVVAVDKKSPDQIKVADAFTPEPYVVSPATNVDEVARRMAADHIGCALILEKEKLVGIFTTVDACRTLAEVLSGRYSQ